MDKKEEPAPEGYEWQDIKSFDENGKAIFKRELVKLEVIGGPTEEREATEEVKKLVEDLKSAVEEKSNKKYNIFEAVKFTTQVVNGVMYRIKVKVGENEYIHLKALKDLPAKGGKVVLRNVADGEFKLEDPIK